MLGAFTYLIVFPKALAVLKMTVTVNILGQLRGLRKLAQSSRYAGHKHAVFSGYPSACDSKEIASVII